MVGVVSSVMNMQGMFNEAASFNHDLSGWRGSNIASAPAGFDALANSWLKASPVWGMCPS